MATVNMTRCQNCKAIMNPNWTACLVCRTGVAHPELAMTLEAGETEARLKAGRDPEAVLADAYRRYWSTEESEPVEVFRTIHLQIDHLEKQVGEDGAWHILETEARVWHQKTGVCPFCRQRGELHFEGKKA